MKSIIPNDATPHAPIYSPMITIKQDGKLVKLPAEVFAKTAFDSHVTIEEFTASLDAFSEVSLSPRDAVQQWRDVAVSMFIDMLEEAGVLKVNPAAFMGGSDFDDEDEVTPDQVFEHKNFNFQKE